MAKLDDAEGMPDASSDTGNQADSFQQLVGADEVLSSVHSYWRSKWRDTALPSRDDIAPAEISTLLPNVGLIDVLPRERNFRYRLVGTYLVDMFGRDFTGTKLGEPFKEGSYGKFLHRFYQDAVDSRAAVYCESSFRYRGTGDLYIRRLVLPIVRSPGQQSVSMLFFSNTFYRPIGQGQFIYANAAEDGPFMSEDIENITLIRHLREPATDERHSSC